VRSLDDVNWLASSRSGTIDNAVSAPRPVIL
jgi:hypothetical protein